MELPWLLLAREEEAASAVGWRLICCEEDARQEERIASGGWIMAVGEEEGVRFAEMSCWRGAGERSLSWPAACARQGAQWKGEEPRRGWRRGRRTAVGGAPGSAALEETRGRGAGQEVGSARRRGELRRARRMGSGTGGSDLAEVRWRWRVVEGGSATGGESGVGVNLGRRRVLEEETAPTGGAALLEERWWRRREEAEVGGCADLAEGSSVEKWRLPRRRTREMSFDLLNCLWI